MKRLGTLSGLLDVRMLAFMLALLGLATVVTAPLVGQPGAGPRSVDDQEPMLTPLTGQPNAPAAEPRQSSDEALEMRQGAPGSVASPAEGAESVPQIPLTTESGLSPSTGARVAPADTDPISDEPAPVQPVSLNALPATMAEQLNPPPRRQESPDQSQR